MLHMELVHTDYTAASVNCVITITTEGNLLFRGCLHRVKRKRKQKYSKTKTHALLF